jgi:hypothetical protein
MLHCTMGTTTSLQMGLDDLLADLRHARRTGELGRLALLAFCDVRSWARQAGLTDVAEHSLAMFADQPHTSREAFLTQIDGLILELEQLRPSLCTPNLAVPFRRRQGNEQPQEASA